MHRCCAAPARTDVAHQPTAWHSCPAAGDAGTWLALTSCKSTRADAAGDGQAVVERLAVVQAAFIGLFHADAARRRPLGRTRLADEEHLSTADSTAESTAADGTADSTAADGTAAAAAQLDGKLHPPHERATRHHLLGLPAPSAEDHVGLILHIRKSNCKRVGGEPCAALRHINRVPSHIDRALGDRHHWKVARCDLLLLGTRGAFGGGGTPAKLKAFPRSQR